jgi:hypothetical protein
MKKLTLVALIYLVAIMSASAATPPWTVQRDAGLGFHFSYPRDLFQRTEGEGKPSFHYFVSRDAGAKFMVGAWNNERAKPLVSSSAGYWPIPVATMSGPMCPAGGPGS